MGNRRQSHEQTVMVHTLFQKVRATRCAKEHPSRARLHANICRGLFVRAEGSPAALEMVGVAKLRFHEIKIYLRLA